MKLVEQKRVNIYEVIKVLKEGGLVVYPTETTYGVGVDATNPEAIEKLTTYKSRPLGKPYSVMVANQKMANEYVVLNDTAKNLYKNFLPGPMTVISRVKEQKSLRAGIKKLASGVASEIGTVGIRIPSYPIVTEIVKNFGRPITATSANASYKKRPYKISDILENISLKQKKLIDLIIDAGELPHNEPSTVVDTTMDDQVVLRVGDVQLKTQGVRVSRNEEETRNLGNELWKKYGIYAGKRAVIFALEGEMGVGKTVFTKGLAKAIGIDDEIVSPTFSLNNQYQISNFKFEHMDAWRMQSGVELEELGLRGMINDKSVLTIEWADRVAEVIRKYTEEAVIIWVKIGYGKEESERHISWGVS